MSGSTQNYSVLVQEDVVCSKLFVESTFTHKADLTVFNSIKLLGITYNFSHFGHRFWFSRAHHSLRMYDEVKV
jgi:hypothetical protein